MIPYSRQQLSEADLAAVREVLASDFLTQGPQIPLFEQKLASYSGARHAVAVTSGTSALHLACLSLGLGEGDWLWTSPNSFVASANCAVYCGARVDFVDIQPGSHNMCAGELARKLEQAAAEDRLPKVVVPVDYSGQSCDMRRIRDLSKQYGFYLIEDASHALGGHYLGERIGNCSFADICVFSFHAIKNLTTGEGGALLTNNDQFAEKLALLRTHGVTRESAQLENDAEGPWYYEQQELGYNYRMTDIQAALGASQLSRLDSFVDRRRSRAAVYDELLLNLPVTPTERMAGCESAFHLYPVAIDYDALGLSRKRVFEDLRAAGIGVNVHYIPIHTQPFYRRLGFAVGDFPNAERHYQTTLSLPVFVGLETGDQEFVVSRLARALGG